jgi:hypothetical protein
MRNIGKKTAVVLVGFAASALLLTIPLVAQAPALGSTPCSDAAAAGDALYIRQGATGNGSGSDWTNAITTLPTTLTRGRTYCVADTTTGFGAWNVTSHATGTTPTKIVKATVGDHGTNTGWVDTFGDGQAIFGQFSYSVSGSGFLEINGQRTTCGALTWTTNGSQFCGFQFNQATTGGAYVLRFINGGQNSIVRYTEIRGPSGDTAGDFSYPADAVGLGGGGASNLLAQSNYIHNNSTCVDAVQTGAVYEYNLIANCRSNNNNSHSNVIFIGGDVNGLTWRYNVGFNYNAEGVFLTWFATRTGPRNVSIYGNVMYSPNGTFPRGVELRQADGSGDVNYQNILIYNNTFVSLNVGGIYDRSGEAFGGTCTGCSARNNLSVNAPNSFTNMTQNNNTDDSSTSRFVNVGARDFHLMSALTGVTLTSPYNLDLVGNTRGADGTWDRGAYEFGGGTTLSAPTNLRVIQ